jgi:hypothetical protein
MDTSISAHHSETPPMSSPLLPQTVSRRLGAALSGRSPKAFRQIAEFMGPDKRVLLCVLEQLVGHEITVDEYLAGVRSLDRLREREREYKGDGPDAAA